jgi:hypothetical protein
MLRRDKDGVLAIWRNRKFWNVKARWNIWNPHGPVRFRRIHRERLSCISSRSHEGGQHTGLFANAIDHLNRYYYLSTPQQSNLDPQCWSRCAEDGKGLLEIAHVLFLDIHVRSASE